MITTMPRRALLGALPSLAGLAVLAGCGDAGSGAATADATAAVGGGGGAGPTDAFPVTVEHQYGRTVVPSEPRRVVSVGLTEQDVLLELGVVPVGVTEWYAEQPSAVWPWARGLLGEARPTVLSQEDGFSFEAVAALAPDLIVGTNAGMDEQDWATFSAIAPTVTSLTGSDRYSAPWRDQTRQIARALGRSAAGEALIAGVEEHYAAARAANPGFAGRTATFTQGAPWDNNLYVYPDGVNTDFLTELGFRITPGLEAYAEQEGQQALISGERTDLLDADVVVVAAESAENIPVLLDFGTMRTLDAVRGGRTVFADDVLSGAVYFLTPLSQKYVVDRLVPHLAAALAGDSPQAVVG
ncbi:ABC transporter substrate-binding protein [Kineococcus gynurae]|uniref:ABC transporter substrate-binding protein n=1 Tax=Kineococcus gynurae TaxID=452979 RepID=A0ABV5LS47_9ACTN